MYIKTDIDTGTHISYGSGTTDKRGKMPDSERQYTFERGFCWCKSGVFYRQKSKSFLRMHIAFVPLTEDNRLCAKEIIGNVKKLTEWQDKFWTYMVKRYPKLEQGESASKTGQKHIPPRVYKEMAHLNKQRDKLNQLLNGVNVFNAKSRADEINKLLDSYIPAVEQMKTQLKKYKRAFTDTVTENQELKKENEKWELSLERVQKKSVSKAIKDMQLQRDYENAVELLEHIPKEILEIYAKMPKVKGFRFSKKRKRKKT